MREEGRDERGTRREGTGESETRGGQGRETRKTRKTREEKE